VACPLRSYSGLASEVLDQPNRGMIVRNSGWRVVGVRGNSASTGGGRNVWTE
jgi:hypothetical protein